MDLPAVARDFSPLLLYFQTGPDGKDKWIFPDRQQLYNRKCVSASWIEAPERVWLWKKVLVTGAKEGHKSHTISCKRFIGDVYEGSANDCLWANMKKQKWPGRRGGLYRGCGACTQGKYIMVETSHISDDRHVGGESLKVGRSLLLESGKFLVDRHSLLVLWSQK